MPPPVSRSYAAEPGPAQTCSRSWPISLRPGLLCRVHTARPLRGPSRHSPSLLLLQEHRLAGSILLPPCPLAASSGLPLALILRPRLRIRSHACAGPPPGPRFSLTWCGGVPSVRQEEGAPGCPLPLCPLGDCDSGVAQDSAVARTPLHPLRVQPQPPSPAPVWLWPGPAARQTKSFCSGPAVCG